MLPVAEFEPATFESGDMSSCVAHRALIRLIDGVDVIKYDFVFIILFFIFSLFCVWVQQISLTFPQKHTREDEIDAFINYLK